MVKQFFSRELHSNVYLVYDGGEGMIIDCGAPATEILNEVKRLGIAVKYIVLSHGHFDHVDFIEEYIDAFPDAKLMCHENELQVLLDMEGNVSTLFGKPRVYNYDFSTLKEGDSLSVGELNFKVEAAEEDYLFDEIGCGLKIKELQTTKQELLNSLQLYYKYITAKKDNI